MARARRPRDSRFELLRIIAMAFIVAHHFAIHGGYGSGLSSVNQGIIDGLIIGGKIGVNLFVLISGYFLVNSDIKPKKIIELVIQVTFYSLLIYIIFAITGLEKFSFLGFVNSIFAVTRGDYWFVSAYLIMYVLSPFINKLFSACTRKQMIFLCCFLFAIQIGIFNLVGSFLSNVGWFIALYILAGLIRQNPNKITDNNKIMAPVAVFTLLLIALLNIVWDINIYGQRSIVALVCSVAIFCVFKNIKPMGNKHINLISSATLGIYLIHDNNYIRPWLWKNLLNCPFHAELNSFWLFAIASIVLVFLVCLGLELLRDNLFYLVNKQIAKHKNKP